MQSPLSFERYAENQRRRLEDIRRATAKERELLRLHVARQTTTTTSDEKRGRDAQNTSSEGFGASAANLGGVSSTTPYHLRAGSGLQDPNSPFDRPVHNTRWSSLNDRATQLHELDKKLTLEEEDLDREEFALERRYAVAEGKKRHLLEQLSVLQRRESDQREREITIEKEEKVALQSYNHSIAQRKTGKTVSENLVKDKSERQMRLLGSRRKLEERKSQADAAAVQMRQQLSELEGRVVSLTHETKAAERSVGDLEVLLRQDEMRVRDGELDRLQTLKMQAQQLEDMLAVWSKGKQTASIPQGGPTPRIENGMFQNP